MVVDDEVLIRLFVADALRDRGYEVVEASDGDEALALLTSGVDADLLITDVRMPGQLDGIALAWAARGLRPGLPIVLSSGYIGGDAVQLPEVVDAFLPKPYLPAQLVAQVEKLLARR